MFDVFIVPLFVVLNSLYDGLAQPFLYSKPVTLKNAFFKVKQKIKNENQ